MLYFLVEAPYEKCFDIFFQNELGYPNFYRLAELLPTSEEYPNLTLVAPYQAKELPILEKITQKVALLGMKYMPFGHGLETGFNFGNDGKLDIHPQFKEALHHALSQFLEK